jgi:hypothetical protein
MTLRFQPISQALNPRRPQIAPALLLALGLVLALGAAAYGFLESRRTERLVIAVRPVPYGQRISAEDLGVVELPLHRPAQLAGIADPAAVVGSWAAREIGANDLLQPSMLLASPPDQPVYPNGRELARNAVPLPFSVDSIGPLTDRDRVNIGFIADDPALCSPPDSELPPARPAQPYACRFLTAVPVLYIESGVAYLEVTPYQAHAVWALQGAGVQLWGERYGAASDPLPQLQPLDAAHLDFAQLLAADETEPDATHESAAQPLDAGAPGCLAALPGQPGVPGASRQTTPRESRP